MYTEYACYDEPNEQKLQENIFKALEHNIHGISVPYILLGKLANNIPHGITISSPIDWPLGKASTTIRNHAIIHAINQGVTAIDLVASNIMYINSKETDFINDIVSNYNICKDKKITLRIMMEYRVWDNKNISDVCSVLKKEGVEYIFPSTGHRIDNHQDNMIVGHYLQKSFGLSAITNGNVYNKEHYDNIVGSGIYGIRFHSVNSLHRILSGV